jgi:hypothetical protein
VNLCAAILQVSTPILGFWGGCLQKCLGDQKKKSIFHRVVYHGDISSFFGIGILPVSDLTGWLVFRSVYLVWRELPFSAKGGLAVSKRGPVPLFSLKKGFPPKNDTKMFRPTFPLVLVW